MERSFKTYCWDLLKDSSVTGISSIATSDSWFRRLIKLLFLCFVVTGFLLQTHEFLQLYWEFSTVPLTERIGSIQKPSITICDENIIRRRYLCENWPDMCQEEPTNESLCVLYASHCLDPKDMYYKVPLKGIQSYPEEFLTINVTKESGFEIERGLLQCKWLSKQVFKDNTKEGIFTSCGDPEFLRGMTREKRPGACYTLKAPMEEDLNPDSALRMIVSWRPSDEMRYRSILSHWNSRLRIYRISFHYPGRDSNPFLEGFRIHEGKMYQIKVTQRDTVRLPPPYSTKCYDYVGQWKKNRFKGPLGKQECLANCEINAQFKAFGCVPRGNVYPHDKKLCAVHKTADAELRAKVRKCTKGCRDACKDTDYFQEAVPVGVIDVETGLKDYDSPSVSILNVYFDKITSHSVIYKPKYESIELFSYVGGYLAMWLGWSLLAMFDLVEILFNICKYPLVDRSKVTPVRAFMLQ